MKLSVIIPVYNEKRTILKILKKVLEVPVEKEIIIVDDGSTDGTKEILQSINDERIKIIFKEKNEGKGTAIREGLKHITGDIVVIQDADLEYNPFDWLKMIEFIKEKKVDVVFGSRILGKNKKSSFVFHYGGKLVTFLTNLLYGTKLTDAPTCYKMVKKEILDRINLKCKRFEFCQELTAKLRKRGYKIYEVPISYNPRSIREGKKIRWKDGIEAIWTLIKYKFID
ncbi:MAG: glycosyltransferase family 2 protein [Candidatus Omnitrophica bacterium]|nr:glycosyltransferase family 2 protein [Candidatus Omnitrophota bacterium]MCM8806506.1 glycosyltransferase family 2 protein [Candidatus Omnitrophota bacterium]